MENLIENPVDAYSSDESIYVMGENGDFTGSPYGYVDEASGTFVPATAVTLTPGTTTTGQATDAAAATNVQQQTASTTDKKPWYDVVLQLIGAGASGYATVKAADSGVLYNANGTVYQPSTTNDGFKAWGWVILGILLLVVLWVYINSKK